MNQRPEWLAVLMLLSAPLFASLRASFAARIGGRSGPPLSTNYRRLAQRLLVRSIAVPHSASVLRRVAPPFALAAAASSAWALAHLITAPAGRNSDHTIALIAWLFTARAVASLAAIDSGNVLLTISHTRSRVVSLLIEPALLLSLLVVGPPTPPPAGIMILAALGFALATWSYGESRGEAGDLSGPALALTVWSQEVTQLCLWSAWLAVFVPWPPVSPRAVGPMVAAELALVALALGAIDARVVRSAMAVPRHAPLTALAFAVVAMLATALLAGVGAP